MKAVNEVLEEQLETYEEKLKGLKSYIKELSSMCEKHGTSEEHLKEDQLEAENNIKYYEDEIARIKREMGKSPEPKPTQTIPDTILPQTAKQGLGSLIISSISFVAGALLGASLKSRRGKKDRVE